MRHWLEFLFLLAASLAGCASGPPFEAPPGPPEGYAQVVMYRTPAMASAAWAHHFWIDAKPAAELRVNGYTHLLIRPGIHEVHAGGSPAYRGALVQFNAEAGKTYFFRYGAMLNSIFMVGKTPIVGNPSSDFYEIPEDAALVELRDGYRYQAPLADRSAP